MLTLMELVASGVLAEMRLLEKAVFCRAGRELHNFRHPLLGNILRDFYPSCTR